MMFSDDREHVRSSACESEKESWSCKNMKPNENDHSMDYEKYSCAICGKTMKLYYDEMR